METNSYENYGAMPWIRQQNQQYEAGSVTAPARQQPPVLQAPARQPGGTLQKPKAPERMPKARAVALARTFKKWLVVASLVGFGTFSGLAAFHQVASTTTASQSTQSTSGSSQSTSKSNSSSNNNSFLKQGGNNVGSSSSSSGSSSTSQAPVSGSGVS